MSEFKNLVDRRFSDLLWSEEHSRKVLDKLKETPQKRATLKTVLVFAVIMALCATVALAAVVLMRSPEAEAIRNSKQVLIDEYGLTAETVAFFEHAYEKTDDGWVVTFFSVFPDQTGEYVVTSKNGAVKAVWSYDGADPASWENGDLESPIWRQKQLHAYLQSLYADMPASIEGDAQDMVVYEEGTDADSVYMSGLTFTEAQDGDISSEDAKTIALSAASIDAGAPVSLSQKPGAYLVVNREGRRMWCISFHALPKRCSL